MNKNIEFLSSLSMVKGCIKGNQAQKIIAENMEKFSYSPEDIIAFFNQTTTQQYLNNPRKLMPSTFLAKFSNK